MPIIEAIVKDRHCYGCFACYNSCKKQAITIVKDEQGFPIPQVNKALCIECGICGQNCPVCNQNYSLSHVEDFNQRVYSVRNKNIEIRKRSSSGGLFTALSDVVLEQGGCVIGAVWDENLDVKHTLAFNSKERDMMVQSKYVQSDIGQCFLEARQQLDANKLVLFTGTPCQVAGLKLFLKGRNTEKLILCDVLCGGNVSPLFFHDYLRHIEMNKKDRVKAVCFRTKKIGWNEHHIRVELEHSCYEGARRDNEPFFYLYLKKLIVRSSCFSCAFASTERLSDLTMGDFWGIDKIDSNINDDIGVSFLAINSKKGLHLFDQIKDRVLFEERSIELAVPRQINLRQALDKPKEYDSFWQEYKTKGAPATLRHYTTFGLKNRSIQWLKNVLRKL